MSLVEPTPVTWITYVPGAALDCENPEQPVASMAAPPRSRTSADVITPAYRLLKRQKTQPNSTLRGRNSPAKKTPRPPGCAFMAEEPPPSGLLVSMVNVTFWAP